MAPNHNHTEDDGCSNINAISFLWHLHIDQTTANKYTRIVSSNALVHTHTIVVSCHSNGRTWVHSIRKRFSFAAERKCYSGYMSAFCSVPPPSSVHSATMKFFSQMYSVRVLCVCVCFFPRIIRCSLSVQHQTDRMRLCVERNRTYKCMTIPTMYRGIYEYTHAHWQYEKCTRNHFGRRFRQSWHFFFALFTIHFERNFSSMYAFNPNDSWKFWPQANLMNRLQLKSSSK